MNSNNCNISSQVTDNKFQVCSHPDDFNGSCLTFMIVRRLYALALPCRSRWCPSVECHRAQYWAHCCSPFTYHQWAGWYATLM